MDRPMPMRTTDPDRALAARAALAVLAATGADGEAVYDQRLNDALAPLRQSPAVKLVCGRCIRHNKIAWAALDPQTAVVHTAVNRSERGTRQGGISTVAGHNGSGQSPMMQPTLGYRPGSPEQRRQHRRRITPTGSASSDATNQPLRRILRCKHCRAEYSLKNSTLLRKLLEAYMANNIAYL